MKKILGIIVLGLLLSGCAESGGEVLSSLIYGMVLLYVALLGLVLIGMVLYPVIKVTSVVAEALYPKKENTREGKKEIRKAIKNQLVEDKKFIKTRWKKRKWQYPDKRKWQHPTYDDWYKAVQEAKDRIWFANSRNKGPRPLTKNGKLKQPKKVLSSEEVLAGYLAQSKMLSKNKNKKKATKEKKIKLKSNKNK